MPQYEVTLDNTETSDTEEEVLVQSATDVGDALTQAINQAAEDATYYDEADVTEFDSPTIV